MTDLSDLKEALNRITESTTLAESNLSLAEHMIPASCSDMETIIYRLKKASDTLSAYILLHEDDGK